MKHPVALLLAALASAAPAADAAEHIVLALPNLSFSEPDLVIAPGDTVRFENGGGFHNVRQVVDETSLAPLQGGYCAPLPDCTPSGAAWSSVVAFPTVGVTHYLCEVHGTTMRGKITVTAGSPPVAVSKSVSTLEDHGLVITLEGSDPDATPVFISLGSNVTPHGELFDFDGTSVRYVPGPDYVGEDAFEFTVSSGGEFSTGLITVDVLPDPSVNDAPSVPPWRSAITGEGAAVDILLTGQDPDGESLTFALVGPDGGARHGVVSGSAPHLVYVPNPGFFGYDRFSYTASDGAATSPPGEISVHVVAPPLPAPGRLFAVPLAEPGVIVELGAGKELRRFVAPCTLPTGAGQDGLAYDGTYLWALCNEDSRVLRLDPDDGALVASIPVDGGPFDGIAMSARLLLNRSSDHVLQVRSADSGQLEYTVDYDPALAATGAISGYPGGGSILMAASGHTRVFDPVSNALIASFPASSASGIAAMPEGVVTAADGSPVATRMLHDGSASSPFPLPYPVRSLAGDQGLSTSQPQRYRRLFAAPRDSDTDLIELDPASGAELNRFEAPMATRSAVWGETGLAFDGESLWYVSVVPPLGATPLFRLDPDTGAVRETIPLAPGKGYDGLAVAEGRAWLFDHQGDGVLQLDLASQASVFRPLPLPHDWIGGLAILSGFDELLASTLGGHIARADTTDLILQGEFPAFNARVMGVGALTGEILAAGPFDSDPSSLRFFTPSGTLLREVALPYRIASLGADDVAAMYPHVGSVVKISGDAQAASPGAQFAESLDVLVLDAHGHPVPHLPVSFKSTDGRLAFGARTGVTVITGRQGRARAPLATAGMQPGSAAVSVWAAGSALETSFELHVDSPAPAKIFANGFESPEGAAKSTSRRRSSASPGPGYASRPD